MNDATADSNNVGCWVARNYHSGDIVKHKCTCWGEYQMILRSRPPLFLVNSGKTTVESILLPCSLHCALLFIHFETEMLALAMHRSSWGIACHILHINWPRSPVHGSLNALFYALKYFFCSIDFELMHFFCCLWMQSGIWVLTLLFLIDETGQGYVIFTASRPLQSWVTFCVGRHLCSKVEVSVSVNFYDLLYFFLTFRLSSVN